MDYKGSCHCGAVKFEIEAPEQIEAELCNCSICSKAGYLHLILPLSKFRLLSGANALAHYDFNSGVANHSFCRRCGIKPFYTPRSNPDGIDINVNCLDDRPKSIKVVEFDGLNWELHGHKLAAKSQLE